MSAPLWKMLGGAALVLALTAAIMAAAPYLAGAIVVAGFIAYHCGEDESDDKKKPP